MDMTRFIYAWADAENPTQPVSERDLGRIEDEFDTILTEEYRVPILRYGTPMVSSRLSKVLSGSDLWWGLHQFVQPRDIIEWTKYYRLKGLPHDEIVIAEDCDGQVFCLPIIAQGEETDYPIAWYEARDGGFFDVAPSFGDWIEMMTSFQRH